MVKGAAALKFGSDLDFSDVFRFKSRASAVASLTSSLLAKRLQ